MISEESFKLFSYIIRFGRWSRIFPYKWNDHSYSVEVVPNLNRWRVLGAAGLLEPWVLVAALLAALLEPGRKPDDVFLASFIAFTVCFATCIQFFNLLYTAEFASLISTIFIFARRQAAYHRADMRRRDGTEALVRACLYPMTMVPFFAVVGDMAMTLSGHRLYRYLRSEHLLLNLAVAAAWLFEATAPYLCIAFFFILALNYTHSMSMFLTKLRFDPEGTEEERLRAHFLYRTHQVLHQQTSQFVAPIIAVLLIISCTTQILSFYSLVRASDLTPVSFKILLAAVEILTCGITKLCLDFAMIYTRASREFPSSFRVWYGKLPRHPGTDAGKEKDLQLYRSEKRLFRTHRPFKFMIGDFFCISETTFVVLTSTVVLQNIVSLLAMS